MHNSRIPTAASSSSQLFRRFRGAATRCTAAKLWFRVRRPWRNRISAISRFDTGLVRVDCSPVNWPFSHVNQPRFAPTLRPAFAGWPPPKVRCLSSSFFFPPVNFSLASSIESDSNGIAGRPTIYASFRAWPYSENKRSLAQSVFTDDLPALAGTRPPGRSRSILSLFLFDVTVQSCVWQDISVLYICIYMEILDCLSSMYCAFEGCNNRLLVPRKNFLWYLIIFNERVVEDLINVTRKGVDRMFSFVTKKKKKERNRIPICNESIQEGRNISKL